jgi:hypothetical protein
LTVGFPLLLLRALVLRHRLARGLFRFECFNPFRKGAILRL